jgi:hypothetical protein
LTPVKERKRKKRISKPENVCQRDHRKKERRYSPNSTMASVRKKTKEKAVNLKVYVSEVTSKRETQYSPS